jgi:cytochrome c biogenesis protein CcdA
MYRPQQEKAPIITARENKKHQDQVEMSACRCPVNRAGYDKTRKTMKTLLFTLWLLLCGPLCPAQVLAPAHWRYYPAREQVSVGEEIYLYLEAKLERGWQLYSSDMDPALGPVPAGFAFVSHPDYRLVGAVEAVAPKQKFDPVWEGELRYFEGRALFRQRIRILGRHPLIRGSHTYQLCSKKDGRCIMGEGEFSISGLEVVAPAVEQKEGKDLSPGGESHSPGGGDSLSAGVEQVGRAASNAAAAAAAGPEAPVKLESGEPQKDPGRPRVPVPEAAGQAAAQETTPQQGVQPKGEHSAAAENEGETSLWGFALLAFGGGLAALLTPCVFPIIPLTVTYFTFHGNKGKGISGRDRQYATVRKALLFGLSVVLIYTVAGTLLAWLNGPAFANFISTHWLPNLFFFAVFMLFALSFLGMFDIRLPPSLVNRVDRHADKGGALGIFFMAFTLTLVSFSCTGPIVGSLLVASAGGAVLLPLVGMAAFALAIALPFTLLALFPHWLKQLPHSGGWLNSVKVVLGFLELALGLKFLSVADQVYGWGILDRPVFLALWIVIFSGMGFYLLGMLRLPHDSTHDNGAPEKRISAGLAPEKVGPGRLGVPRLLLGLLVLAFVVYLLPGMFGAPLAPLAGYLPPLQGAAYAGAGMPKPAVVAVETAGGDGLCDAPLWGEKLRWPHGLQGYFDLEQALACAREQGKPLFIAFTGHGCVNCREMEARVWSDPRVLARLREDYVLLALYVDEREELPESQWYRSSFDGRIKKTLGMQNADYQVRRFGTNAQPLYVLLDPESGGQLLEPIAYEREISRFIDFLDRGKKAYRALYGDGDVPVRKQLSRTPSLSEDVL